MVGEADLANARQHSQPRGELLVEGARGIGVPAIPQRRQCDVHRHDAGRVEPGPHRAQILEGLQHQPRRGDQHDRERHLRRNERATNGQAGPGCREPTTTFPQRGEIEARASERQQPENQARQQPEP